MFNIPIIDWILSNRKYNDLLTVSRFVVYFLLRRGKSNNRTGSFMPEPNVFTKNENVKNSGGILQKFFFLQISQPNNNKRINYD